MRAEKKKFTWTLCKNFWSCSYLLFLYKISLVVVLVWLSREESLWVCEFFSWHFGNMQKTETQRNQNNFFFSIQVPYLHILHITYHNPYHKESCCWYVQGQLCPTKRITQDRVLIMYLLEAMYVCVSMCLWISLSVKRSVCLEWVSITSRGADQASGSKTAKHWVEDNLSINQQSNRTQLDQGREGPVLSLLS